MPANRRPSVRRAPRWHETLAVALPLAAAACSGVGGTTSTPPTTQPMPAPTGTTAPGFDRSRFAAIIPIRGAGRMTVADGQLWVLNASGTVVRVDPRTNAVVGKPLRVPADADAIAVDQGILWVTSVADGDLGAPGKDRVARIDLATGRTVATIAVGRAPLDIAVTPRAVWVTNSGGGGDSVVRIDPHTNRVAGRPVRTGASPQSLALGAGSLWVANHDARTVSRIGPPPGRTLLANS
jgi:DNA-binding beta-propeller fold protein YncE